VRMDALVFTGTTAAGAPLPPPPAQAETTWRSSNALMVRQARRDGVGITMQWGLSGEWWCSSARKARGVPIMRSSATFRSSERSSASTRSNGRQPLIAAPLRPARSTRTRRTAPHRRRCDRRPPATAVARARAAAPTAPHALDVRRMAAIALGEREPFVTTRDPFGALRGEWNEPAAPASRTPQPDPRTPGPPNLRVLTALLIIPG
jgi:hypothetical protein